MSEGAFSSHFFHTQDDLRLHYREYGSRHSHRTPLLCLSGLTRNAKDFDAIARRHAATRRVLALDCRGRGLSGYDPDPGNYQATVYLSDIHHLLAVAQVERVVVLGTSMGGILAMGMSAAMPAALAGVILNDIGPVVAEDGRQRIADHVGTDTHLPSFDAAAGLWRSTYLHAYPKLDPAGWLRIARATFTEDARRGGVRLDYDLAIATGLRQQAKTPLPDLWPLFRGLRHVPVLALRGALSDILDTDTFVQMKREHAGLTAVTIPDVGHVPLLDEPAAEAAIDAYLEHL